MTKVEQYVSRRDGKCRTSKADPYDSDGYRLPCYESYRSSVNKLKSACPYRPRRHCGMMSNCAINFVWIIVTLLSLFLALQVGSSVTHARLASAASIESRRVSYFLGRHWRRLTGISSSSFVYPGIAPPYLDDSICSSYSSHESTAVADKSVNGTEFPVCLSVSVGDDSSQPHLKALPYQLIYSRLFRALQEEVTSVGKGLGNKKVQVLVAVDYESIVCKMVRDFDELVPGMVAQCRAFVNVAVETECGVLISGRSERFVSQSSLLFREKAKWLKSRSVDLDCPIPEEDSPLLPEKDWRPTVVTGFTSNHLVVGLLMLRSLGKAAKDSGRDDVSVVVYAMEKFHPEHQSLLDCVLDELNSEYKVKAEMRTFDFSAHPQWMRINHELGYFGGTGEYAWKAIMVHTVLRERGIAVWADAGDRFMDKDSLAETLRVLQERGFVSRKSHGTVWTRTHPLLLKFLRADLAGVWDRDNCEAAVVGFTLKKYKELARPWFECSTIRQCIAPDGSDRSNHRQDQAALTVLSVMTGNSCDGAHPSFGHHMDDDPIDTAFTPGAYTTRCYLDPLRLDMPQGTHLDQGQHSGPYLWH